MKRLFEVEKKYYVMAENEIEAEMTDLTLCEATVEVSEVNGVDTDWWDSIPANSDDDKTCGEIITEQNKVKFPRERVQ